MAAHGLHLRPRDFAKVGQLMLDDGRWNGVQVVSKDWKDASTSAQAVPANHPELFDYGYYWWLVKSAQAYSTWGHGGQYAFVVPSKQLVLVQIGMPDTDVPNDRVLDPVGVFHGPRMGRDPERTPMPWTGEPGAGYSSPGVEPWLPDGDVAACHVADQRHRERDQPRRPPARVQ